MQLESPDIKDAADELFASLDEAHPAKVDVVASESSKPAASLADVAPTKVNVEKVIPRPQEEVVGSSEDVADSEVTESTIDSSTATPVETTLTSYKSSSQNGPDFGEIDLDGQTTCAERQCTSDAPSPSQRFGTAIEWAASVEQAARLAGEQDKLVFLIQVSGNFAREGFT